MKATTLYLSLVSLGAFLLLGACAPKTEENKETTPPAENTTGQPTTPNQ